MKSQQPRAELRILSLDEHGWAWCYVEPDNDVELFGNETYRNADEAREWARRAYPEVPFAEDDESSRDESGKDEPGKDDQD